ncbi:MAG: carbohydrate binding family 9 domain-containing protein [Parvularculaceae bacterium]
MRRPGFYLTAAIVALCAPAGAFAADDAAVIDFEGYTPRTVATRIDVADAPVIDGDLSDAVWARAQVIEDFYQVSPEEGAPPSQKTKAYILYDDKNLYIGVYNYDDEPDRIIRSQMSRDPALQDDDGLRILLDPFGSFRDAYFFGINANGARNDALTENNRNFRDQWNTIWTAKARVVEDGWIAEMAIPFQSISFDRSLADWNMQIIRTVRRKDEEIRWSNIDRTRDRIDMTNPGRVSGIEGVKSGIGLEIQPYVTSGASYDWQTDETDYNLNPSANIFYKVTPALTASLTFNTDFSDTGLDQRQVNTGRFSLFFPETRDFFLQDSASFEFGNRIFTNGPSNGLPFFSRNIGIVNGHPVDIVAGAKLSGKLGPANIGAVSARTGAADALGIDGQYLSAARVTFPVLAESRVGAVFTNGDPTGEHDNTLTGADFQYKKSNLWGGTLTADLAYMRTFDDGESDGMAAAHVAFRSNTWNMNLRLRDIGPDYAPRLGFINRTDFRHYTLNGWRSYNPNGRFIRYAETGGYVAVNTTRDDERLESYVGAWVFARNNPGDEINIEYEHQYEDIRDPFDIAGELPVAAGVYRHDLMHVRVGTATSRPISGRVEFDIGDSYGGDYMRIYSELTLRPSKHFEFAATHDYIDFDLPSGALGIHISALSSTIAFTPDMAIKTEVQYDNISEGFTWFSRFSWEPLPEREIFLAFGHTAIIDRQHFPKDFTSQGTSLALRLGHTFRL